MDIENKLSADMQNELSAVATGDGAAIAPGSASAVIAAAIQALTMVPDASGQLVLPDGVELDDIRVAGRDLIIKMPDGTEMVIPDGAIFVPQFVLNGVAVPPLNIAALLIGQEPAPAAGRLTSSGGNFADPVGDIGDPFARGDLLPPTELRFPEPVEREIIPDLADEEPTTIIITPDQPAGSVSATARVNEAGLPARGSEPAGSNEPANSETTIGNIVFDTPDGFGSITLNGTPITTVGQVIVTPQGRLTITSIAAGDIGYSYTLIDNTSGDNTADVFAVIVTDRDGDTATANLTISIVDDVPTARNDTDSVAAANYTAETGNVITSVGTTSGTAGADTQGADGAIVSGFRAGTSGSFAGVGTTINGQYGTLRINADGSYSYTRSAGTPGGVTDTFSYQLTDGDGDNATATLVISIADSPVSITSVPTTGGGTIVFEEGLPPRGAEPSGSNSGATTESTSGVITFIAPDGVASVQINGTTITGIGQVITLPTGTFVVTSFNPAAGTLGYTFTLTDNTSGDATVQSLTVTVTDTDGDSDTRPFTITIVDDVPTARDDSGTQATENAVVSVNVFANDTSGADGVNLATGISIVAGTLSGTGGLVYNNDGTFTYTPAAGEEGVVTFQYRITDGDGDPSTATVTITLLRDSVPSIEIAGDREVEESGLPLRGTEPAGSNAASNGEIASGTLNITTGNDTISSLVINGINVISGGSVIGASGTLVIALTGSTYSYTYTLADNTSGDATSDSFNVVVTDSDGDSANSTLVIAIIDDLPVAANDTDNIAAGQYGPATGNVITDVEGDGGADTSGADGVIVSTISGVAAGVVGGSTSGQYGILTLNADGSYSYVRNAGTPGGVSDTFNYTIRDGDGDTATATLVISIADSVTTLDVPTTGEAGTLVNEAGLPAGSNAASDSETTTGTITFTAPDGPATVTIDGVVVTAVGQVFTGSFGAITITSIAGGAIGYSYTLTTNTSGDATFDAFSITVADQDGDSTAGTLVIDIIDDVPTARPDTDTVTEDSFVVADGNVISGIGGGDANLTDGVADTRGADGASVTAIAFGATAGVIGAATAGAYGALTINADGSYSYSLNNSLAAVQGLDSDDTLTEVFTYTLTDGDGDVRTTTLTITINGSDDPITINGLNVEGPELIVDEDDLPDGSSPNAAALTQTGSFTVNGTDGIAAILIEGTNAVVGQTFTTAYGVFTVTSVSAPVDGTATSIVIGYSYTLTDNTAHLAANGQNLLTEIFDITVTDTDGSTDTATIEVRIIDDVPTAVDDTDSIASGSFGPATGNVITDAEGDGGGDTRGADGAVVTAITGAAAGIIGGTTAGTYGVLTLNSDGSYSYARNAGTPGGVNDVFTYTVTDSDGDTATATLTITIADAAPITGVNATVLLDDDALAGGNPGGTGDDADSANVTGILAGSGGDGALSWTMTSFTSPVGFSVTLVNPALLEIRQGATLVMTVTVNNATGAYTVTQVAPIDHAALLDENNTGFTLGYRVTDADGDTAGGTLSINIDDDTPTASDDFDSIVSGSVAPATGNVITDTEGDGGVDSVGADGGAAIVAITGFGGVGSVGGTTNGQYGVLTINADGGYSYVRNSGTPGNVQDAFTYTLTDADGDQVTATLTITIEDARPVVGPNAVVLLDDDALSGGNPGGTGDDANASNISGTLSGSGGDGTLSWAYLTTGAPAGFTYVVNGTGIDVLQGATVVLRITLDTANGSYTVAQLAPIQHASGNDENNQPFVLNYTVTDTDGDFSNGTLSIDVDDDTPVVVVGGTAANLVVDETSFGTNDTENFSGLFTSPTQYGADGAGSTAYTLGVVAGASNLIDTLTGQPVVLALFAGVVVGTAGVAGPIVFTLSVDASGNVTLDQSRAVVHTPNGGPDDVASLTSNLVTLTQTVTDRDGDIASATASIGGMVRLVDDAPTAGANAPVQLDDDSLGGNAGGTGDANPNTANTSGIVSHTMGNDGGSIAFATTGAPVGYRYTASGSNVLIQQEQGIGNWVTVATVTLNSATGAYTVTQNAPVIHPLGGDENDVSFTLSYTVTDGDADTAGGTLVINIDDDTPIAVAGVQSGTVDEDGLANGIAGGTGDVGGEATTATGSVTGLFSAGADAPLTYQLTGSTAGLPALTSGGVAITYTLAGNVLTASAGANSVFTLTLNAATGQWDFALLRALDHANGANENDIILQFGGLVQATDRDGDSVIATGTLTITVDDDSPLISGVAAGATVLVDETSANPGGFPISASSAASVISAVLAIGADGSAIAGTPAYAISLTAGGATTLVTALGGFAITLVQVNATTIAGQYTNGGTQTAFTVAIDPATGIATLTQNIALEHNTDGPEGAAHNDALNLSGLITATVTVTDRDGDSHSGSVQVGGNISFLDDGPSITATGSAPLLTVDETNLVTNSGPTSFAGVFTTNFGADGGTQIAYTLAVVAGPSGLVDTATGQAVVLSLTGGGVVEGRTAGSNELVFTLTVNAGGSVTLDQLRAVVHSPDSGPNQSTTLSAANLITLTAIATDNDGDTDVASINIGQSLVFLDDAPTAGVNAAVQLDDDSLGGNAGGTGDANPNTANTSGIVSHTMGNDGGSIAFATTGAPVGYRYTASGSNVLIQQEQGIGNWVTVATVTLNSATGAYTVTQNAPVIHPLGGDENDVSFTLSYTVTDGDADTAGGTLVINIDDDTPIAVAGVQSGTVDEDGLANGIAGGTGDVGGEATTATGSVTGLFSAGADAPLTYQLTGSTAGLPALTSGGVAITYTLAGNVLTASAGANSVFTLTLNAATGQWDFALLRALDHANGANENDIILQFGGLVQATDRDGDSVIATGTLTITVDDDTPIANPDSATQAAENAAVTINVFTNDQSGADGTLVSSVAVVGGSLSGTGSLVNNANGTFTYTPSMGETGIVTFQYTITDRDGDIATATATITLLADSTPAPVNVVAAVDDDGLAGGNAASITGDINANLGEPGATPSEAIYTGAIAVNFGSDTGTVSFANLHNTSGVIGTETVNYTWNTITNILTATGPRGVVFTVSLTPSGAYTVTLVDNVLHTSGGNETSALATLNYTATDSDGDSNSTGTLAITFNDDAPTLGTIQNQQSSNTPANPTATGTLNFAPGADGAGTTMTIAANMTGITSGGRAIVTQQVGNVLSGYADVDNSGTFTAGDTAVFTLTVDPAAGTSGQYTFDLLAALDGVTNNVSIGSGSSFGVGPSNSVIVGDTASSTSLALVTGWLPTGGFTPAELSAWQAGGSPTLTQQSNVNGSTAGFGLGNNNLDNGEFMRLDFGAFNDYDGAGGYTPPAGGPFANVSFASFSFANFGSGDTIIFVAHYTDGSTASFTRVGGTDPDTFTLNSPAGLQLAWIDIYESTGSIKLNLTNVGVTATAVDRTIPFTLQLTDADGDATSTGAFTVRVGDSFAPLPPSAEAINTAKFAITAEQSAESVAANDNADGTTERFAGGALPAQMQLRDLTQANILVAATVAALVGTEMLVHDPLDGVAGKAIVSEMIEIASSLAPQTQAAAVEHTLPDNLLGDGMASQPEGLATRDYVPETHIWESIGLASQELPVEQPAYSALSDPMQLPNSGAPMLSLSSDTGLIDALLLVQNALVDTTGAQLPALHDVIAETLNDNGIDHLLDQLTGPVGDTMDGGRGSLSGGSDDLANALIHMPISNDTMAHFSTINITDQLQEMAIQQG